MRALIYVSGPYTADTYEGIELNIRLAEDYTTELWALGFGVFCPHSNTRHMEERAPNVPYEDYMEVDKRPLLACDGIFMLPGWRESRGANEEREYAIAFGIPIWYNLADLEKAYPDGLPDSTDSSTDVHDAAAAGYA